MKRFKVLLAFFVFVGFYILQAQNVQITGIVTSADDGSPLPGVSVMVKGTYTGTITDFNGAFQLAVPQSATTLVFSFVGMKTQEVPIAGQTTFKIALEPDILALSEVVVTAIGIKREEKALGYSATQVTGDEITKGRNRSVLNSLQGKIAGVNISTASGAPGASTKIILRGYSSIAGNNQPLFVIDGVPVNNSSNNFYDPTNAVNRTQDFGNRINDINPDDVESISVLKGAAATALYGSRAASGVIMITTKGGTFNQKLNVDVSSSYTLSNTLRLPQLQNVFGQGWSGHFAFEENGSWGPPMDGKDRVWGNIVDHSQQIKPFAVQKNNLKDFYDMGKAFQNSISLNGGNENANYYLSYSNTSEDGILPTDQDSYNRNTLTFKGEVKGKKITSKASVSYINKTAKYVTTGQGGDGTTVFQEIIQIPRDMCILDFKDYNYKFNNLDNYFTVYAQNPYFALSENGNQFNEDRVYGNIDVDYNIISTLKLTYRVGTDVSNSQLSDWVAIAETSPTSPNATTQQIPGAITERSKLARELNSDLLLSSTNNLTSTIKLNSLIGYNVNERYFRNTYTYGYDLNVPKFYKLSNASAFPSTPEVAESKRRLYGVYGQFDVDFNSKLFVTLGARNDWSSTLPKDNNSFFYPTANASLLLTELLPGLQSVVNFGKLRLSWGKTGNDAGPYSVNSVMVASSVYLPFGEINFPIGGVNAFEVSNQIGNPSLQPEITSEIEVGTDLRFLKNRIGLDIAYYDRVTEAQILAVPIPTTSGYTTQIKNFGKIQNKGVELLLNLVPVKSTDFQWDINLNYSKNKNEVLELTEGLEKVQITSVYGIEFNAIPGKPIGVFKGHKAELSPDGKIVVNSAGIPVTDPTKVDYGDVNPKYLAGVYNTFKYKNLNLSFGFDIRQGGLIYSYTRRLNDFVGNSTNSLFNYRQPFIVPNSVIKTEAGLDANGNMTYKYSENTIPVDMTNYSEYWNQTSNNSMSREHIYDRSYVKLREVVFRYSLPKNILGNLPVDELQFSLFGRNLLLWTPEENNIMDPEITTFGNDLTGDFGEFAAGPTVRHFGGSIKVSF